MKKIVFPPPAEVDENYRFYVFYSATNVVVPIALHMLVSGIGNLFHTAFGLTPHFTVYIGMPLFWIEVAAIFAINCWIIWAFPGRIIISGVTILANIISTVLAGSTSFYLSLPTLALFLPIWWEALLAN